MHIAQRLVDVEGGCGCRGEVGMSARRFQRGDRVEWTVGAKVMRGKVESVGSGKNEGIATVWQDGYDKSRVISINRLSDRKTHTGMPAIGPEVA